MEQDITKTVAHLVLQLAVILAVAKIGGEVCQRYLKIPPVLGELAAGITIGPHALGGVSWWGRGSLFEVHPFATSPIPVSTELYAVSQIAAIVLLFHAGLETDLRQLLRYKVSATLVAVGGVVLPFILGAAATVALGFAASFTDPVALFMGAIMTATSVGITARVLADQGKLDSPEGVTIMGAAVVDDVLGIMVLTVAVGIGTTGHVSLGNIGWVGVKAVLFWLGLTGLGILLAPRISRFFSAFKVTGSALALALALAFLSSGLAESFGLAMIIGAYSIGLAISETPLARNLKEAISNVYHALVPVFFVVMGMLVNVSAMREAVLFGVVLTLLAVLGKAAGCGAAAIGTGFNLRGAWRIGIGMLPRGEVALIIAGAGLARGVIQEDLFGVSIMMTVVTTVIAPIIMVSAFEKGGPGRRAVKTSGVSSS